MRFKANRQDLWSGVALALFFFYFAIGALAYNTGTLQRMGPGFLPLTYSMMGIVLGGTIAVAALGRSKSLNFHSLRPALAVFASIVAFAVFLPRFGLVPATIAVVGLASLASSKIRWHETALLAAGIALLSWLVFIALLRLPMRAIAWMP